MVMKTVGTPALWRRVRNSDTRRADAPIGWREQELFWGLHGRIFYMAIRKFVYQMPIPPDDERAVVVSDAVRQFILGNRRVLGEMRTRQIRTALVTIFPENMSLSAGAASAPRQVGDDPIKGDHQIAITRML